MIRAQSGFERFMIFLTTTRKFRCVECGQHFREPDRRRTPRDNPGGVYVAARYAGRVSA
jgi:hypothetical protein